LLTVFVILWTRCVYRTMHSINSCINNT
jgi:hypothetical protein